MNIQALLIVAVVLVLTFISMQRADPTRRAAVRNFVWFVIVLVGVYGWLTQNMLEVIVALVISVVINAIYWGLIGRYNPAHSSDEIRVLGMDD
ncbi:MAG: hypothetical protein AAF787_02480 [Chloroflexota bacterium]